MVPRLNLGVIPCRHIDPGKARGPVGPQAGRQPGGGGKSSPPLAGSLDAAGDIRSAVAVEISDLDVHPRHGGRPLTPELTREARVVGLGLPPLAALQRPADDVRLTVAVEIADSDINPSDACAPGRPQRAGESGAGGN